MKTTEKVFLAESDLDSLKTELRKYGLNPEKILEDYFQERVNSGEIISTKEKSKFLGESAKSYLYVKTYKEKLKESGLDEGATLSEIEVAINDKIRKDYARCVGLKENATWEEIFLVKPSNQWYVDIRVK